MNDDWTPRRIYRETVFACMLGLLGFVALQMWDMRVNLAESAIRQEQCIGELANHETKIEQHEYRIHGLEVDVSVLKSQVSPP